MKQLFTFFMLFSQVALAQEFNRYMVFFKDKAASPYSIEAPEEFLTPRAVERRVKFKIPLTEQDLPVNEQYVQQIREQGIPVFYRSRWLNAVMVQDTEAKVGALANLPFVQDIVYVAPGAKLNARLASLTQNPQEEVPQDQHDLLGIPLMQELGYTGQGKLIAVFDDGFRGVNTGNKFDHLYRNNHLLHTWDFVANAESVYQYDDHGTRALSTIAVVDSGTFVGTAPDAQFLLAITEDYYTEYVVEEYNWLIASEWADSLGADIITSSLGYTTYDDPSMDYTQSDMDGQTTIAARAATWATDRGMLVVSSAGNSRSSSWGTISTPADAENILAVGAITATGEIAPFSSFGPSADGRIKPDVVAQGVNTVVVAASGSYVLSNGTSFSGPQIAGMAASIWQAFPHLTNLELREAIIKSANQYANPDSDFGYGVPNFERLMKAITNALPQHELAQQVFIYPNPVAPLHQQLQIMQQNPDGGSLKVVLIDLAGRQLHQQTLLPGEEGRYTMEVATLPAGLYYLQIISDKGISKHKFLRL